MEKPRLEINNLSLPAYRTFSTVYRTSIHTQLKLIQLNLDEIHHIIQPKTKPLKSIKILQQRFYNVDGYARADRTYVYCIPSETKFSSDFLHIHTLARYSISFYKKCKKSIPYGI